MLSIVQLVMTIPV